MRKPLILLSMILLLSACGPQKAEDLLAFQTDDSGSIVYEDRTYFFYGLPEKSDMTEQIGILDQDTADQIYTYQSYPMEEFIIEFYRSGEMDVPSLYRAEDCVIEPEGVYVLEEE